MPRDRRALRAFLWLLLAYALGWVSGYVDPTTAPEWADHAVPVVAGFIMYVVAYRLAGRRPDDARRAR